MTERVSQETPDGDDLLRRAAEALGHLDDPEAMERLFAAEGEMWQSERLAALIGKLREERDVGRLADSHAVTERVSQKTPLLARTERILAAQDRPQGDGRGPDGGTVLETALEAARAYTVAVAAINGALGQLHWIEESSVTPEAWAYIQGARGYLEAT